MNWRGTEGRRKIVRNTHSVEGLNHVGHALRNLGRTLHLGESLVDQGTHDSVAI